MSATAVICGLGRRKSSVARVRLRPGAGGFLVNDRPVDEFFRTLQSRRRVRAALAVTQTAETWDVAVNVQGGGPTGQADAVVLGIARALKKVNPGFDDVLRANGLLTRDSRMKERKKYGRKRARKGFQYSKR